MSIVARQSTALETAIGPILDASGVAVTNGVVGDFKIKKTTGNFAALNGSATLTHVSAGVYDLVLTTSDTDTVGLCCIAIDDTVNACQSIYLQVMEEAIYDALYAASANAYTGAAGATFARANTLQMDSDADAASGLNAAGLHYFNFNHFDTEQNILSTAITTVTSQTIFVLTGGSTVDDAYNDMLGTIQSANATDKHRFRVVDYVGSTKTMTIDAAAPFTVTTAHEVNVVATPRQVTYLPNVAAGGTNGVFIAGTNAATTVTTALTANVTGNLSGSVGSLTGFSVTGTGLTAIPWNASWDAEVQSEVQDAIEANHLDHLLAVTYDPASKPGAADALLNELVESDAGVARYTANALEQAPAGGGGGATAAAIADAVWDELQADHVAVGSFGIIASEIASILVDTNELQVDWTNGGRLDTILDGLSDIWSISLPGAYAIGTAGYILGTNLDVAVSSRLEETPAVAEIISTATSSSVVRICNIALSLIGEPTITSMADATKSARLCDLRFSDVLDSVLRAHPWNSAKVRVSLTPMVAAPTYGYTYQFQLPTDFLRFVEAEKPSSEYKFEGSVILANFTPFKMVYVQRVDSVSTLDELLRQAVAARLAYELCVAITRNSERANMLWQMYEKKLAEARFIDAGHTSGQTIRTETWLNARIGTDDPYRGIS